MSSFTKPLVVEFEDNGMKALIRSGFEYYTNVEYNFPVEYPLRRDEENPTRIYIVVPENYHTDFASVPRFLWWWMAPIGRHTKAAVIHDWLYTCKVDRKWADRVFYDAMGVLGVNWFTKRCMYWAVRWFGHAAWADPN